MPKRIDTTGMTDSNFAGAVAERSNLEVGALIATGTCVAAPSAVVLGSLQTTFVVGGVAATVCAVGAHRVANGEELWPFGKKDDEKKAEKKADDKSTDSDSRVRVS